MLCLFVFGIILYGCVMAPPQVILQTRVSTDCPTCVPCTPCSETAVSAMAHMPAATTSPAMLPPTLTLIPTPTPTHTPTPVRVTVYMAPDEMTHSAHQRFGDLLSTRMGQTVDLVVPADYAASVAAIERGQADVAWLSTPAYLIAHECCGARALFAAERDGRVSARSQLLVLSATRRRELGLEPIRSLQDMEGRTLALTSVHSPTGYLYPLAELADAGVSLAQQLSVASDGQVVLAVYRGEVDAGASYWSPPGLDGSITDARVTLMREYPGAAEAFEILRLSPPIPNDPIVFSHELAPDVRDRLVVALSDLARSDEGRDVLDALYGLSGLSLVADDNYDIVRRMLASAGMDPYELLNEP